MRSSSVRLPFLAAAAIAGLLLVFASGDFSKQPGTASASHAGGADKFLIDMDPTGNTATSVATIQDCARINKNGVQDADEDAVDTVFADVVALGIPISHPMVAFEVNVRHGTGIVIDGGDFSQMLASNSGSGINFTDVFQTGPDATVLRANDPAPPLAATAEAGSGVLVRARLRAGSSGPLVVPVTLFGSGHVDPNTDAFAPDNSFNVTFPSGLDLWQLPSSRVAIDQQCPPPQATTDVSVTSAQILPAVAYTGEPFTIWETVTLHNFGPQVVSSYWVPVLIGLFAEECIRGPVDSMITGPPIPAGGSVSVSVSGVVTCDLPTIVTAKPYAAAIVLDANDGDLTNNVRSGTEALIPVLQSDADGDGVSRAVDLCPNTPAGATVDAYGCSLAQVDSDGDGICNDNAPSNGPWPGCVRSVAVGGALGLLDESSAPESAGLQNSSHSSTLPPIALAAVGAVAFAAAGVYLRRRRA